MWDNRSHRHFYRRSYRSAPPKLMPAIISCQSSTCLIVFGLFFLIAGSIARFMSGDDSPPSKAFDTPFFNEHRKEYAKGPRIVGTVLLIVSAVMIGIALIGFIISCVLYRNYENDRRAVMMSTTGPHAFSNPQALGTPVMNWPAPAPPPAAGFQYPNGYQQLPVSQNVVYYPTTEPNRPFTAS